MFYNSCAKCERPFRYGTEDTVTINKKTYHSDCLSCDQCSKPYDGSFTPDQLDQEALCRECTHNQKRPKSSNNNINNTNESKITYVKENESIFIEFFCLVIHVVVVVVFHLILPLDI